MQLTKEDIKKGLDFVRSQARKFAIKTQPLYQSLNWEWAFEGMPTVEKIESTVHELCYTAERYGGKKGENIYCATGGIEIRISKDNYDIIEAALSFNYDHTAYLDAKGNGKVSDLSMHISGE